ncbi:MULTISPECIES: hypothetical protein [unclassified Kitasatospora]|uniref:hypothetical protein n=1 Tax=unclassified Kitasatospora TaxID=2633591 RepID=UPI0033D6D6C5
MSDDEARTPLGASEQGRLELAIDELTSAFARELAGVVGGPRVDGPIDPEDDSSADEPERLAYLRVLKHATGHLSNRTDQTALGLIDRGTDLEDVAQALGVGVPAVRKRFGSVRQGERVAVVISRRDRVRHDESDPRGSFGEVGGYEQYASDRGVWPIGAGVRAQAEFAIVAVDGVVRRVYRIDPDGWREHSPRLWEFTAVGGVPLTPSEIRQAQLAGDLPLVPGDSCPTRAGGAYRPHRFHPTATPTPHAELR